MEGRPDISSVLTWAFAVAHLVVAAVWLGSMSYSLTVVQPKVARFFADDRGGEDFLTTLAHGNRWRVVGLIGGLVVTGVVVAASSPHPAVAVGYGVAVGLYLCAGAIFAHVSWRHWPARVFALPAEVPGFQHRLRVMARTMLGLVAVAFGVALAVTAATGVT